MKPLIEFLENSTSHWMKPKLLFFAILVFLCCPFLFASHVESQPSPQQSTEGFPLPSSTAAESNLQNGLQEIIVCMGDSITQGFGLAYPDVDCYVPRLSVLSGITTLNKYVYGGSGEGVIYINSYLDQYRPQTLTIYYGNNDAGNYTTEEVIANLRYMVDRCLSYGTTPVIATLGPQFGARAWRQPLIIDINQGIRQLAAEKGIPLADIDIALNWDQRYWADDIHPNSAGHAIIANTFFRAINKCAYGVSPLSESFLPSSGAGSVSVTTGSACSWTAVSNADWITVTGGSSGVGNGTVFYKVTFNNAGRERTGTLTIAGKTFTVTQKKAPAMNYLNLLLDE
jgi:lysophospholipase L1-like esterase